MRKIGYGLAIVLVAALAFFGGSVFKQKPSIESATLSEGFREISQLSVEEYRLADIAELNEPAKILGRKIDSSLTNKKLLYTYEGYVKAGIPEYENVEFSIDKAAKKVIIKSPKVEVTDAKIDDATIKFYLESDSFLNKLTSEDRRDLRVEEEKKMKERAIEKGLLDRAKTRAEEMLKANVESIISGTEQEGYTVEVQWVD